MRTLLVARNQTVASADSSGIVHCLRRHQLSGNGAEEWSDRLHCKALGQCQTGADSARSLCQSPRKREERKAGLTTGGKIEHVLGNSSVIRPLRLLVEKVSTTDANILITGENGTGKDMLAREIHRLSSRRNRPMVAVDMGAITESLFESELFGHVKVRLPMPTLTG